jgi:hypothetical protein
MPGKRPDPPSQLSPEEAKEWAAIVGSLPPDFFPREVHPILIQLCRLIISAADVAALLREVSPSNPDEFATYTRLLSLQMALSGGIASLLTKLRCTNQSRYSTRTAERQSVKARTKPWDVIDGGKSDPASDDIDSNNNVVDDDDENAWN